MNWDAIGAIGEIVGAFAVVLTLFYLAAQIKQSSRATQAAAADAWVAALQKSNELQLANEHTMDVWHRGAYMRQPLEGQDLSTYKTLASSGLNAVEKLYIEHLRGNVEDDTWESANNIVRWILHSPAGFETYQEWSGGKIGDPRFREFMAQVVSEYEAAGQKTTGDNEDGSF